MDNKELDILKALIDLATTIISLASAVVGYKTIKASSKKRKK